MTTTSRTVILPALAFTARRRERCFLTCRPNAKRLAPSAELQAIAAARRALTESARIACPAAAPADCTAELAAEATSARWCSVATLALIALLIAICTACTLA